MVARVKRSDTYMEIKSVCRMTLYSGIFRETQLQYIILVVIDASGNQYSDEKNENLKPFNF